MSIYFREVDLLDWDNLLDMNTQMGRHLVVPNVKVRSWSCSINSLNPHGLVRSLSYWNSHWWSVLDHTLQSWSWCLSVRDKIRIEFVIYGPFSVTPSLSDRDTEKCNWYSCIIPMSIIYFRLENYSHWLPHSRLRRRNSSIRCCQGSMK